MSRKEVTVSNVSKKHDNPIAELVQVACQFDSNITLESDNRKINAKSIMGIMAFNPSKGMTVNIVAEGNDEEEALAKKAETVVKKAEETVKKAEETAKKAETTVKAAAKTTAKKATKKAAAKKTAKAEKKELVPEVFVQFDGNEDVVANVIERAKEAFTANGHRASSIKSLKVYLKPEEYAAYYVINDTYLF